MLLLHVVVYYCCISIYCLYFCCLSVCSLCYLSKLSALYTDACLFVCYTIAFLSSIRRIFVNCISTWYLSYVCCMPVCYLTFFSYYVGCLHVYLLSAVCFTYICYSDPVGYLKAVGISAISVSSSQTTVCYLLSRCLLYVNYTFSSSLYVCCLLSAVCM